MSRKHAFRETVVSVLLCAGATASFGQTAEITGRVTDSSGGVIPNSDIVGLNVDTGVRRPVKSNEAGYYSIPLLPPANYEITVQMSGFKPLTRSGVRLEVNQIARIDFVMEVGDVTESITVDAQAPLVSSEEHSIGTVVDGEKVHQLPLNGRNPFNLVTLTPGVTSASPSSFGRRANISGGRDNISEVLIDGGATTSTDQGDLKITPPLEAVAEFKVQTASFEAEYGRSASVISMVTKSGTNELHGSLFEFMRNDAFDANNYFFNASGQGKQKLRYNQFGGAIGGPVYIPELYDGRNRSFFFFTAEYTRQRGAGLKTSTLPTALERAGDFSQSGSGGGPQPIFDPDTTTPSGSKFSRTPFPNSVIPAARFHPVALNILKEGYPLPTGPGRANNFIASGSTSSDVNAYTVRGDHYFTPENRLSIRYARRSNETQNAVAYPGFPAQGGSNAANNLRNTGIVHSVVLREMLSIRPNLLNEFNYSLLYNTSLLTPASANQGWSQKLGFKNTAPYLFPTVNISGYSGLFGGNLSEEGDVDHQFGDNITWIKGAHTVKAGFEVRPLYFRNQQPGGGTAGNVTFNTLPTQNPSLSGAAAGGHGVASLLLGVPSTASLSINDQKWGGFWRYYATFVQDKWKISPKLTATYGLRWEYTRPRKERWNRQSVFNLDTLEMMYAGEDGFRETLFEGDFRKFAPRIGFAYSPQSDGKTAIRGAFGLFYLPISNIGSLANFAQGGFTANRTWQTTDGGITFPLTLSETFPQLSLSRELSALTSVNTIGPKYPSPVVNQWTLSIQREMFANTLFDVTYVGTKGTHLQISGQNFNQVPAELLGPGNAQSRRPYPTRGNINYPDNPVANSIYHGVHFKIERRFAGGLNLLGWYSLSKSIDDSSGVFGFRTLGTTGRQDNHNLRAERAISTFDRTHTAVVTGIYELPFGKGKAFVNQGGIVGALVGGWQMNGILTLRSGVPLAMGTSQNLTGSLGGGSRPNRLRSGALSSGQSIQQWFDTAAFERPAQFTFGNTSRTEPDVRGPGTAQLDFSLYRNINFTERAELQIRAEAFNALNRVNLNDPNTTIGASAVGTITGAQPARIIQLGARFVF